MNNEIMCKVYLLLTQIPMNNRRITLCKTASMFSQYVHKNSSRVSTASGNADNKFSTSGFVSTPSGNSDAAVRNGGPHQGGSNKGRPLALEPRALEGGEVGGGDEGRPQPLVLALAMRALGENEDERFGWKQCFQQGKERQRRLSSGSSDNWRAEDGRRMDIVTREVQCEILISCHVSIGTTFSSGDHISQRNAVLIHPLTVYKYG